MNLPFYSGIEIKIDKYDIAQRNLIPESIKSH